MLLRENVYRSGIFWNIRISHVFGQEVASFRSNLLKILSEEVLIFLLFFFCEHVHVCQMSVSSHFRSHIRSSPSAMMDEITSAVCCPRSTFPHISASSFILCTPSYFSPSLACSLISQSALESAKRTPASINEKDSASVSVLLLMHLNNLTFTPIL